MSVPSAGPASVAGPSLGAWWRLTVRLACCGHAWLLLLVRSARSRFCVYVGRVVVVCCLASFDLGRLPGQEGTTAAHDLVDQSS